jgi:hypothetical protein
VLSFPAVLISLLPPPPDGAEQGAVDVGGAVDVPLVAEEELDADCVDEQVSLPQFVHPQALQLC